MILKIMLGLIAITTLLTAVYFLGGDEYFMIAGILTGFGAGITFIAFLIALIVSAARGK